MNSVAVLGSGVALGVYVPALVTQRRLAAEGVNATVEVYETLYQPDDRDKLGALRAKMQSSFEFAQLMHRVPNQGHADPDLVCRLHERWRRDECRRFIVWSGFWLPVLDEYANFLGVDSADLLVDICRIDAVESTSFRRNESWLEHAREIWFWRGTNGDAQLVQQLGVGTEVGRDYHDRATRCLVHGGGWGLGTFRDVVPELLDAGVGVDLVADDVAGAVQWEVPPDWEPWDADLGSSYQMPPFGRSGETPALGVCHAPVLDVIANRKAIVSKPGGGTLMDSLATATPIVFLDAYGPAEAENERVWQTLGFGLAFDDWRRTGFSFEVLADMHDALNVARRSTPDYASAYATALLGVISNGR